MFAALLVWLIAILSAGLFFVRRWWFPDAINQHARQFDSQFALTMAICGGIFLAAHAALGWIVLRYRRDSEPSGPANPNPRLELFWTAAAGILFVGLTLAGTGIWAKVHLEDAEPALRVEVAAKQFAWSFRYPGPDRRFGRTDPNRISDASGNPFGLVDEDPATRDDIVTSSLRIPVGTPVELILTSRDVIHNFFVRELRLKQDLVPGMTIPLRFSADKPGTYEVACSELCGLGHHQMRTVLIVQTREDYEQWLTQMLDQLRQQQ